MVYHSVIVVFFFFQAEDGIRDAQESRGLGDVYKRQSSGQLITWVFIPLLGASGVFAFERQQKTLPRLMTTPVAKSTYLLGVITGQLGAGIVQMILLIAVSYTHLTLPTIYSV